MMGELTRQSGSKLLVAIWPMLVFLDDTYPFQEKHALVESACHEYGISIIDMFPAFKGHKPESSLWVNRDDYHPNALANRIAAEAIYQALIEKKLVPASGFSHANKEIMHAHRH